MPQCRFYFDYAASTPVDPRVEKAMRPYFLKKFGNAGSLHSFGQEASSAMDNAREIIAKAIGRPPAGGFREVIFTGSATEANNLAIRGAVKRVMSQESGVRKPSRVIVSAIEHESILETARDLEHEGVEVIVVPVTKDGIVKLDELKSALDEQTILVSVMYANNEIGTIQPIAEISEIIRNFRDESRVKSQESRVGAALPLLHTDAVQAFQFLNCDVEMLGVDMMTLSAHKIYGPKGVGALYVRSQESRVKKSQGTEGKHRGVNMTHDSCLLTPIITGGGQEFGLRSGTENVPLIVGFAKAVELLFSNFRQRRTGALARRSHWRRRELENKRIMGLRDYFWKELKKIHPSAQTNADYTRTDAENGQRKSAPALSRVEGSSPRKSAALPNMLNIYFPAHEAQYLLAKFDLAGIAVSAGSACSARSAQPSYVITALGYPEKRAKHSIRFSFGRQTTRKDIDSALRVIRKLL